MTKKKTQKFSRFLKNPVDYTLVITILLLLAIGLVMVLSASSPTALSESGNSYKYFAKQLLFAGVGIFAMCTISKIDYRFYQKFYKHAWWLSIILLALVLAIGKEVNEAKRWIYVTESLSFQPSEVVKFLMIIFYAGILVKDKNELNKYIKGFAKHICLVLPIVALLLLQPHFSASIVIIGICMVMMLLAGCKLMQIVVPRSGNWIAYIINSNLENTKICTCLKKNNNIHKSVGR